MTILHRFLNFVWCVYRIYVRYIGYILYFVTSLWILFIILSDLFLCYILWCFPCMYVCMRVIDTKELELQTVLSHHGGDGRAFGALNCRVIFPSPPSLFLLCIFLHTEGLVDHRDLLLYQILSELSYTIIVLVHIRVLSCTLCSRFVYSSIVVHFCHVQLIDLHTGSPLQIFSLQASALYLLTQSCT